MLRFPPLGSSKLAFNSAIGLYNLIINSKFVQYVLFDLLVEYNYYAAIITFH